MSRAELEHMSDPSQPDVVLARLCCVDPEDHSNADWRFATRLLRVQRKSSLLLVACPSRSDLSRWKLCPATLNLLKKIFHCPRRIVRTVYFDVPVVDLAFVSPPRGYPVS